MNTNKGKSPLLRGMRDGIPIGLGYFAVAFSLGIVGRNAGLTPLQGFLASLLTYASAGEYATFTEIAKQTSYVEIALLAIIINARYLLMSSALSQRLRPGIRSIHRYGMGASITDEVFGITIAQEGYLEPAYSYGAILIAVPLWSLGTALGIWLGNLMPANVVSALSVALYGMFLSAIIPPAKKNKAVLIVVLVSFALSSLFNYCPGLKEISAAARTIILTIAIAAGAALIAPHDDEPKKKEVAAHARVD